MTYSPEILKVAHRHSATHRDEVMASSACGCFYCQSVFSPSTIEEWIEETSGNYGKSPNPWTAICPKCGVDSVIGDKAPFPATDPAFLEAMHIVWFGADND